MTAEQALAKIRQAVEVARELDNEGIGNGYTPAYRLGGLHYLLNRAEHAFAELDAEKGSELVRASGGAS